VYTPVFSSRFKADYKKVSASGQGTNDVDEVIHIVAAGRALLAKHRDHSLKGEWRSYRECHVRSDLLLIYRIERDSLLLARLGSHSELFE
jgi:mRNA interferase YafQ